MAKKKYYVVWTGKQPGIYLTWDEAKDQIDGWKGARYKSYPTLTEATEAFRKGSDDNLEAIATLLIRARERRETQNTHERRETQHTQGRRETQPGPASEPEWMSNPKVNRNAIAVDASCLGNPGTMEYRGVDLATGKEIFRVGPFQDATNNVGEYLALVHVLALCKQKGVDRPVYSDSRIALGWLHRRQSRSTLRPTPRNARLLQLIQRADAWVKANTWPNRVMKWKTEEWGEIPADFGRK